MGQDKSYSLRWSFQNGFSSKHHEALLTPSYILSPIQIPPLVLSTRFSLLPSLVLLTILDGSAHNFRCETMLICRQVVICTMWDMWWDSGIYITPFRTLPYSITATAHHTADKAHCLTVFMWRLFLLRKMEWHPFLVIDEVFVEELIFYIFCWTQIYFWSAFSFRFWCDLGTDSCLLKTMSVRCAFRSFVCHARTLPRWFRWEWWTDWWWRMSK